MSAYVAEPVAAGATMDVRGRLNRDVVFACRRLAAPVDSSRNLFQ